jgi:SAM-dependent methyltransferase
VHEGTPWYQEAFRSGYLRVYPHRDLEAARSEVGHLVARGLRGTILDLGCGFGRHSLALREAGLDVFGLDLSAELLSHARAQPGSAALRGRLARGDFRRLPYAAERFDGVLMLFSSFGYFDDAQNERVLGEVARVLCSDGQAVLDLMNPQRVRATLVPESENQRGELLLRERRRLTEGGRRVVKDVLMRDAHGREWSWREDVRLYELEELRTLAARQGLEIALVQGDFDGRPPGAEAPRQIVWAVRS